MDRLEVAQVRVIRRLGPRNREALPRFLHLSQFFVDLAEGHVRVGPIGIVLGHADHHPRRGDGRAKISGLDVQAREQQKRANSAEAP